MRATLPELADTEPESLFYPDQHLAAGEALFEAGRAASTLYVVQRGILKAIVPTSLGRERVADLYGKGDVLGTAALEGRPHAETVVAAQDSLVSPIDPVRAMASSRSRGFVLHSLARQLRRSRELLDNSELPVGARLTRSFLQLSARFGQLGEDGVRLPLALTHEDLASLTGSSRVTITRILGELRSSGALQGTRGVYVADMDKLEQMTDRYVMQVI